MAAIIEAKAQEKKATSFFLVAAGV